MYTQAVNSPKTGTLSAVVASYVGITEQKRAEKTLRESEAQFRDVFERAPIGMIEEISSKDQQKLLTTVVLLSGARELNPSFKLGKLALNRSTSPAQY